VNRGGRFGVGMYRAAGATRTPSGTTAGKGVPMEPDNDAALLAAVGRGDQTALRTLYTAYRLRLWHYLSQQLGGHPELVEETLQDVFVAVWRMAGNFRGEARVATWLYRLAHNHAANARRGAARHGAARTVALSTRAGESGEHSAYVRPAYDDEVAERLALQGA